MSKEFLKRAAFIALAFAMLVPSVPSATALVLGITFALTIGNPFPAETKRFTPLLLQFSVVGLGAGMDLAVIGRVGLQGLGYTAAGIALTLVIGWVIGRAFKTETETSILLNVGTAICGGSAISAVAPVIRAQSHSISISLATVFLLNASALVIFPWLGHLAGLDQAQFGLFSALAVHDTSSVVGTAMQYGPEALAVATTVKLARALWIVPVALLIGFLWTRAGRENSGQSAKKPWFILGFLIAAALVTWVPGAHGPGLWVAVVAKRALVVTLYLIGAALTRANLRAVGLKPFAHAITLWILVSAVTLIAVRSGWILVPS